MAELHRPCLLIYSSRDIITQEPPSTSTESPVMNPVRSLAGRS